MENVNFEDFENEEGAFQLENVHPGVILKEEILVPYQITAYRLAKATKLTESHIGDIIKGKRPITPETAYRLGMALGTSPEFWLNMQAHYDMVEVRRNRSVKPIVIERLVNPAVVA
jgi:antitoxin HigA-1